MGDRGRDSRAGATHDGDVELIIGIRRTRRDALAEVFRRHGGQLHDLASRMCGAEDADEIVAQVLLALWRDPGHFDPGRSSLRCYLLSQTHALAVQTVRSSRPRQARTSMIRNRRSNPTPNLEGVLQRRVGDDTWRRLSDLSDDERNGIALAYFCANTGEELAGLLGQPPEICMQRIRSGLTRLAGQPLASRC